MLIGFWWGWSSLELIRWLKSVEMNSGGGSEGDGDELVRLDEAFHAIHMQGHS